MKKIPERSSKHIPAKQYTGKKYTKNHAKKRGLSHKPNKKIYTAEACSPPKGRVPSSGRPESRIASAVHNLSKANAYDKANISAVKCSAVHDLNEQERRRVLALLGLCLRGGYLAVGGEAIREAVYAGHACLILLAGDAAEHIRRHVLSLSERSGCEVLILPDSKQALGAALGRNSVAAVGVTDIGLANAIRKKCRLHRHVLYNNII